MADEDHDHGYAGIKPANADGTVDEDKRKPIPTAFIIYVMPDGKAIADSDIANVLENVKPVREASVADMHRAVLEVAADLHFSLQGERLINMQMQVAGQIQRQAETAALLEGIDLKGGGKIRMPGQ